MISMMGKISREIANTLRKHESFLSGFDRIILYYDNGQVELTKILTSVFSALFANVEFKKVRPVDYKLFQVADLVCTMELLSIKGRQNAFSRSEMEFFHSIRDFTKNYMKALLKKKI